MKEFPEDISTEPLKYLYLKRKRLFDINGEDDEQYGEGEQDSFTLVYSPNRLETQFPLRQFNIVMPRGAKPSTHDYKYEYFSVADIPELDPLKSTKSNQIRVRSYKDFDTVGDVIEDPIEEFKTALKIIIAYEDGVGNYR